ncbi:MAG: type 2 lantipeptide synthetase LanM [Deltaproteobacteria bacterium]|nr:type 2 lantipeptide synthetase LanM [Deltaproteobacteria bacterium]
MRLAIDQIVRRATGLDAAGRIDARRLTRRQQARWRSLVADDDPATFRKRLAWDGLSTAARASSPAARARPSWAELLLEVGAAARGLVRDTRRPRHVRARAPQPFEEVYRPFLAVARQRLDARLDRAAQVAPAARADLEHALLRQLAVIGQATLAREAERFAAGSPRRAARAFVDALFADGLDGLLRRYSVLGRLWATICEQWIASTAELLTRASADAALLADTFNGGRALGRLARVEAMLGDRHRDGRTVAALTFASGVTVVYKPRRLGLEHAFAGFLAWCNQHSGLLPLRAPQIATRDDYGWVEFVAAAPCRDAGEVIRFHERAGMLLAIFYLLGESDCHSQNLIAVGEHPMPLDLETLLRPERTPAAARGFDVRVELVHDVARTAMLPFWARSREGGGISDKPYPEGALAGGVGRRPANQPRLGGRAVDSAAHVDDVVRGFTAMYRFFQRHKRALASATGPLAVFAAPHAIRYIARGTGIYELLQSSALHPDYLRDGRERAITLDSLSRVRLGDPQRPPTWPIGGRELAALERIDVPLFHASPVDTDLRLDGGGTVAAVFAETSLDTVRQRARALDAADLARQVFLIRAHVVCFAARPPARRRRREVRWPHAPIARTATLVDHALRIGAALERTALSGKDGAITWLAPELSDLGRYQLMRLGSDYGGGAAGIAVFLAALARVTGRRRFAELAERALVPVRRPHGAAGDDLRGIAASVYALTVAGELLGAGALHADARRVFDLVTPARVAADQLLDVAGGAAGLILAALALHRRTDDSQLLVRARALGEHLLARRIRTEAGPRAWRTADGHVGVGLLHGQSGFGLALGQLGRALGDARFLAAADEAFAYERARYSPDHGAWFDSRPRSYPGSLCKGAAGILLARVGSLSALASPELRADCDAAVAACTRVGMLEIDHVCCGNFGRIEAEAVAADILDRPALRASATRKAAALVARATALGGFSLLSPARAVAHPSLYVGVAGVGYTLLRLAEPRRLPALVLWT